MPRIFESPASQELPYVGATKSWWWTTCPYNVLPVPAHLAENIQKYINSCMQDATKLPATPETLRKRRLWAARQARYRAKKASVTTSF